MMTSLTTLQGDLNTLAKADTTNAESGAATAQPPLTEATEVLIAPGRPVDRRRLHRLRRLGRLHGAGLRRSLMTLVKALQGSRPS